MRVGHHAQLLVRDAFAVAPAVPAAHRLRAAGEVHFRAIRPDERAVEARGFVRADVHGRDVHGVPVQARLREVA